MTATAYIKRFARLKQKPVATVEQKWEAAKAIAGKKLSKNHPEFHSVATTILENTVGIVKATAIADTLEMISLSKPSAPINIKARMKKLKPKSKPVPKVKPKGKDKGKIKPTSKTAKSGKKSTGLKKKGPAKKERGSIKLKTKKITSKPRRKTKVSLEEPKDNKVEETGTKIDTPTDNAATEPPQKTWWTTKSLNSKKSYLEAHPNSKMAGNVKAELAAKQEGGTLTDEDKELMSVMGPVGDSDNPIIPESPTPAQEKAAAKAIEDAETHTPSPKEKGIFKNVVLMSKKAILGRIKDPKSVFSTLSKFKNGEDWDDQDRANAQKAMFNVGKAVLITAAFAGVAFLAVSMLPDMIDKYLDDRKDKWGKSADGGEDADKFGKGAGKYAESSTSNGNDDSDNDLFNLGEPTLEPFNKNDLRTMGSITSTASGKEFKVISTYVDDFSGWLADQDLSKYRK